MASRNALLVLRRAHHQLLRNRQFCSGGPSRTTVRVRFAPSPTGFLHLGGFRTALLNYIFALKTDGKFILRIEDTDQTRLVPDALEMIEKDLNWLGIHPHEGPSNPGKHGPYIQSQRLPLYHKNLESLIESGHAYECFCTEKRLELMRREAAKLRQKSRYDNKCRDLTRDDVQRKKAAGEPYCVRFKLQPENVTFNDLVYGTTDFNSTGMSYEGDPVILKSDGYPTYHFANVVDDHYMEITHVFRGVEWQVSTPKHLQMYSAFKWKPPEFAHLPLVLNKDGTKLSKRQGDISISYYRNQSYYPIALTNFVTKSGGGFSYHGVDKNFTLKELADNLDVNSIHTGGCRLDFILLDKLNQLELQNQVNNDLALAVRTLEDVLQSTTKLKVGDYSAQYIEKILKWCPERVSKLNDIVSPELEYLWSQPNPNVLSKVTISAEIHQQFIDMCQNIDADTFIKVEAMHTILEDFSESNKLKHTTFLRDMRLMLCGITKGPPIVEIFQLFGKQTVCERLTSSLSVLSTTTSCKSPQHQSQSG